MIFIRTMILCLFLGLSACNLLSDPLRFNLSPSLPSESDLAQDDSSPETNTPQILDPSESGGITTIDLPDMSGPGGITTIDLPEDSQLAPIINPVTLDLRDALAIIKTVGEQNHFYKWTGTEILPAFTVVDIPEIQTQDYVLSKSGDLVITLTEPLREKNCQVIHYNLNTHETQCLFKTSPFEGKAQLDDSGHLYYLQNSNGSFELMALNLNVPKSSRVILSASKIYKWQALQKDGVLVLFQNLNDTEFRRFFPKKSTSLDLAGTKQRITDFVYINDKTVLYQKSTFALSGKRGSSSQTRTFLVRFNIKIASQPQPLPALDNVNLRRLVSYGQDEIFFQDQNSIFSLNLRAKRTPSLNMSASTLDEIISFEKIFFYRIIGDDLLVSGFSEESGHALYMLNLLHPNSPQMLYPSADPIINIQPFEDSLLFAATTPDSRSILGEINGNELDLFGVLPDPIEQMDVISSPYLPE